MRWRHARNMLRLAFGDTANVWVVAGASAAVIAVGWFGDQLLGLLPEAWQRVLGLGTLPALILLFWRLSRDGEEIQVRIAQRPARPAKAIVMFLSTPR
ncbi:MAG: hypothetical protein D6771_05510, partial [Zetaproteobacteria bacterium]